jgi:hypothetical protein
MFGSEQGSGGKVFDEATAAANAEILPALNSVGGADDSPAHADPTGERVAVASGSMVGHGVIRLRSRSPRLVDGASGAATPEAAATREPVGHGTIRLLTGSPGRVEDAAEQAPEAAAPPAPDPAPRGLTRPRPRRPEASAPPEAAGHGPVRFVDRSVQLDPSATDAAEAEILSVLSVTS